MRKRFLATVIAVIMLLTLCITSAYALGYTGVGNFLTARGDYDQYSDTKTSAGNYAAVNTGESYPNPGQLIGPTSLAWECVEMTEGRYVADRRIGKNARDSAYIALEMRYVGAPYLFYIINDSSVNATYGLTYSINATY